jgi:hypothetical protein
LHRLGSAEPPWLPVALRPQACSFPIYISSRNGEGGHYEECRLLGYINPVRTSQETHYISTTESSRLMLCKIWGFHCCDCEEWRLLGCDAAWLL